MKVFAQNRESEVEVVDSKSQAPTVLEKGIGIHAITCQNFNFDLFEVLFYDSCLF